jgi:hypothetical protein
MKIIALLALVVMASCGKKDSVPTGPEVKGLERDDSCVYARTCMVGSYKAIDGDYSLIFSFSETALEVCVADNVESERACVSSKYIIDGDEVYTEGFKKGDCEVEVAENKFFYTITGDELEICYTNKKADCYKFTKTEFDKEALFKSFSIDCKLPGIG